MIAKVRRRAISDASDSWPVMNSSVFDVIQLAQASGFRLQASGFRLQASDSPKPAAWSPKPSSEDTINP